MDGEAFAAVIESDACVDAMLAITEAWRKSRNLRGYIRAYEKMVRKSARMADAKIAPGGMVCVGKIAG